MEHNLLTLLQADSGLVCIVGAGGKKTIIYQLARLHPGRVAVTATAHVEHFPARLGAVEIIASEDQLPARIMASDGRILAIAQPSTKTGRYAGLSPAMVDALYRSGRFDLCLVKADGARGRGIKAPNEGEPPIPASTTTVIPVLSAKVFGAPLSERNVHRPDYFSRVTDLGMGESIESVHVARLMASDAGFLKNVGNATVVPVINMIADEQQATQARTAAKQALALTDRYNYLVLLGMQPEMPVIDVILRGSQASPSYIYQK